MGEPWMETTRSDPTLIAIKAKGGDSTQYVLEEGLLAR